MIGAAQSFSMTGMSGLQSMSRMQGPPPPPPPQGNMEDKLSQLQSAVESGEIDTDELSAKLTEKFGDAAEGIVSEDGEVDFTALSELLVADRTEKMTEDLTSRFGEEAASFISETGEIDHEGLTSWLEDNGMSMGGADGGPPPPPRGGMGGFGGFGGGQSATSYGAQGQGFSSSGASSSAFINLLA